MSDDARRVKVALRFSALELPTKAVVDRQAVRLCAGLAEQAGRPASVTHAEALEILYAIGRYANNLDALRRNGVGGKRPVAKEENP